jgi:GDP-L-fucose synthase
MKISQSNTIYLAGHSGLLGSAILKSLIKKGYKNIITQTRKELNLTNCSDTESFINKNNPDCVIIAAGKTGGIEENKSIPFDLLNENLQIQLSLLNASQKNNVKKVLFFGSSCMYPKSSLEPMTENMLLTGEMEKTSLAYAIAKISGIQMCLSLNQQFKKNTFIPLIPNSVYGPNDNFDPEKGHVLASLINKFHNAKILNKKEVLLWGTGKPIREFVFSEDLADACLFILNSDISSMDQPINISTGKEYSILQLSSIIAKVVGFNGKIVWDLNKPDGTFRKSLNIDKMTNLGWKSKTPLEKGILSTYDWYLENMDY